MQDVVNEFLRNFLVTELLTLLLKVAGNSLKAVNFVNAI